MSPSRINILFRSKETIARLIGKSRSDSRSDARRIKPIARLARECLEGRELMTAGYFDTSFNQTGKAVFAFTAGNPHASAVAEAVAIQSNGDIVIAGEISPAVHSGDIGLIRLNSNGTLDQSFGVNGRSYLSFNAGGRTPDSVSALSIDSSGRILLAGTATEANGSQEVVVARFASSGSLDKSFGISGRSYANFSVFGATGYTASAMTLDSQGRIIVAGTAAFPDGHHDFGVIRLQTNGYFDDTFGYLGRSDANFTINGLTNDVAAGVALDDFGRIIVDGTVSGGGQEHIGVVRLQTNGTWDTTFGYLGQSELTFSLYGPTKDVAAGVVVDHQGRIVVAGELSTSSPSKLTEFVVGRLTPDGLYDSTFGIDGRSFAGFSKGGVTNDVAKGIAVDAWDRIIVAGSITDNNGNTDVAVIRLLPTGSWDTSFGNSGRSDAGFDIGRSKYDAADAMAIDSSGRVVLAGTTSTIASGLSFATARIDGGSMNFNPYLETITNPAQTSVNGALYTDVTQGGAPTCWIDASIAELASKGVDLSQRIHYQGDNWYTVSLYDRNDNNNPWTGGFHPVTEWVYFDGSRTSADLGFDPTQLGESWTVILQRGIIDAIRQYDPTQSVANPHSGGAGDAMSVLTGQWITEINPATTGTAQSVMTALAAGRKVTLGTTNNASTLVSSHWYAVLSANAQGVTLYNPWGILVTVPWSVVAQDGSDIQVN
jgi:uncharacterized delta-60 repeat protein